MTASAASIMAARCDDDDGASRVPHRVDSPHDGLFADGIKVCCGASSRITTWECAASTAVVARCFAGRALSNGQADAAGADDGIPPVRALAKTFIEAGCRCRIVQVVERQIAHVVQDRTGNQRGGLGHPRDLATPRGGIDIHRTDSPLSEDEADGRSRTRPASGVMSASKHRTIVDFPVPEGPHSAVTMPGAMTPLVGAGAHAPRTHAEAIENDVGACHVGALVGSGVHGLGLFDDVERCLRRRYAFADAWNCADLAQGSKTSGASMMTARPWNSEMLPKTRRMPTSTATRATDRVVRNEHASREERSAKRGHRSLCIRGTQSVQVRARCLFAAGGRGAWAGPT